MIENDSGLYDGEHVCTPPCIECVFSAQILGSPSSLAAGVGPNNLLYCKLFEAVPMAACLECDGKYFMTLKQAKEMIDDVRDK